MAFRNYEKMLERLAELKFENPATELRVQEMVEADDLTEEDLHEIVRLFNIHCIPRRN